MEKFRDGSERTLKDKKTKTGTNRCFTKYMKEQKCRDNKYNIEKLGELIDAPIPNAEMPEKKRR